MLSNYKVVLVFAPILFAVVSTSFWMTRWGIIAWGKGVLGLPVIRNRKEWIESSLSDYERPEEAYPVITIRTLAVNALGIPTVFFLGALAAMQFIRRPELYL